MPRPMVGLAAAAASSLLGGTAIAFTRLAVRELEPLQVATIRYAIAALCLLPALSLLRRSPLARRDWPAVLGLSLWFFTLLPYVFSTALAHTTAARGAIALSTMPLQTLLIGAVLGVERPSLRKLLGAGVAIAGVALALAASLGGDAPADAWMGDLGMVGAGFIASVYNVTSRLYLKHVPALPMTALGLAIGGSALAGICLSTGHAVLPALPALDWVALVYLGAVGAALTFFLWVLALAHTTPTRVAITVPLNPVSAMALGAVMLGEPIAMALVGGVVAVLSGIALANWPERGQPVDRAARL